MLTIYRHYILYGLYSREALAPSIVLHLSREFLFIYEFLLLLTMQSMPTLRNPLIIMAEMRRERGREGSGCCCLGHFARHLWAHFVTVLGPDERESERGTHPRCENHFNCYVWLMQQVPILCWRCLAMRCDGMRACQEYDLGKARRANQ